MAEIVVLPRSKVMSPHFTGTCEGVRYFSQEHASKLEELIRSTAFDRRDAIWTKIVWRLTCGSGFTTLAAIQSHMPRYYDAVSDALTVGWRFDRAAWIELIREAKRLEDASDPNLSKRYRVIRSLLEVYVEAGVNTQTAARVFVIGSLALVHNKHLVIAALDDITSVPETAAS